MKRMVTKMSTVTPMSTLTKSKSLGQGVKNIGKGKGPKPVSMGMDIKKFKEPAIKKTKPSIFDDPYVKSRIAEGKSRKSIQSGLGMPQLKNRVTKTGTISPAKPKAKMLPEVKVTAPSKFKRFVSKLTSTKRG